MRDLALGHDTRVSKGLRVLWQKFSRTALERLTAGIRGFWYLLESVKPRCDLVL
jgi:hypothetical protein